MDIETLKRAGICFNYCRSAVFPQIPCVQDVLYVLQLSGEKDARGNYCPEGAWNWGEYIANTVLVAAVVANRVLYMERYDKAEARKSIAQAIIELCPPEAKCLFVNAFVEAQEIFTGQPASSRNMDRETRLQACGCLECARILREECGSDYDDVPEDAFDYA